jgi:hypothetical protein
MGFEGSSVDFSVGGPGVLSTFGDSLLAGTPFTEETESMSHGILYKKFTCYQVIGKKKSLKIGVPTRSMDRDPFPRDLKEEPKQVPWV